MGPEATALGTGVPSASWMTSWPLLAETLTATCAGCPPAMAVTAPAPTAVATILMEAPVFAPGVASATAPEAIHVTDADTARPPESFTVAVYVPSAPSTSDVGPTREMSPTEVSTVIVTVPRSAPTVTVSVAVPAASAITCTPVVDARLTTEGALEVHVAADRSILEPMVAVTVSVIVSPTRGAPADAITARPGAPADSKVGVCSGHPARQRSHAASGNMTRGARARGRVLAFTLIFMLTLALASMGRPLSFVITVLTGRRSGPRARRSRSASRWGPCSRRQRRHTRRRGAPPPGARRRRRRRQSPRPRRPPGRRS